MAEIYTVECKNVAVSAAQDILAVYAASSRKLRYVACQLAANGQTTIGNLPIRLYRLIATVTHGSGGASVSLNNVNPDGSNASSTARANDTTQATGTGPTDGYFADQFNPINGFYHQAPTPEAGKKADLSDALVLSLDAAPGSTINVSATLYVEEI